MDIKFQIDGNWDATAKWLREAATHDFTPSMKEIGKKGVESLKEATPKDTGETSRGWYYEITGRGGNLQMDWLNRAHPELRVNMALLIDRGHGTGTGGYVPPRPYIKDSMKPVWSGAGDSLMRELNR